MRETVFSQGAGVNWRHPQAPEGSSPPHLQGPVSATRDPDYRLQDGLPGQASVQPPPPPSATPAGPLPLLPCSPGVPNALRKWGALCSPLPPQGITTLLGPKGVRVWQPSCPGPSALWPWAFLPQDGGPVRGMAGSDTGEQTPSLFENSLWGFPKDPTEHKARHS